MPSNNKSTNNIIKLANKKQHFSLRKLSVGVASVLLGVTFATYGTSEVAHAAAPVMPEPTQQQEGTPAPKPETNASLTFNFLSTTDPDTPASTVEHTPITLNGTVGEDLTTAQKEQIQSTINAVLTDPDNHDLYLLNGFIPAKFDGNNTSLNIIFVKRQTSTSHEYVRALDGKTHQLSSHNLVAAFNPNDGSVDHWSTDDGQPATYASYDLAAHGYHARPGYHLTVDVDVQSSVQSTSINESIDTHNKKLADYANDLRDQLTPMVAGATALPSFTVNVPLDITFIVREEQDTHVTPPEPVIPNPPVNPDNPPVNPDTQDTPDKPNKPEIPATPDAQDTPDEPNKPEIPATLDAPDTSDESSKPAITSIPAKPASPTRPAGNQNAQPAPTTGKAASARQAILPQTGTEEGSVIGLAFASILASFGLAPRRKHES